MKFLIIHNRYRIRGGEESVADAQVQMLKDGGHEVVVYSRDYKEISGFWGRARSFFSALYSTKSMRELRRIVGREKPNVALVHNLYPLISAAVLPMLKQNGVRVVYFAHNFRLVCPIGIMFTKGAVCERCGQSRNREWQCVRGKCEGSMVGSIAFAARGAWSRKMKYFDAVDTICTLSQFESQILSRYGVDSSKMRVVANPLFDMPVSETLREDFVGIVGRFSVEKGAAVLMDTARLLPNLKFKVAGNVAVDISDAPTNVEFVGSLNRVQLADFYSKAKVVVSCSLVYETFGLTIAEAMYYGAVVVVPSSAAMPWLVDAPNGGLTYDVGESGHLANVLTTLFDDDTLCRTLSLNGKRRIETLCSPLTYLQNISTL